MTGNKVEEFLACLPSFSFHPSMLLGGTEAPSTLPAPSAEAPFSFLGPHLRQTPAPFTDTVPGPCRPTMNTDRRISSAPDSTDPAPQEESRFKVRQDYEIHPGRPPPNLSPEGTSPRHQRHGTLGSRPTSSGPGREPTCPRCEPCGSMHRRPCHGSGRTLLEPTPPEDGRGLTLQLTEVWVRFWHIWHQRGLWGAQGRERPNEVAPGTQPLWLRGVLLSLAGTQTPPSGSYLERKIRRGRGTEKR